MVVRKLLMLFVSLFVSQSGYVTSCMWWHVIRNVHGVIPGGLLKMVMDFLLTFCFHMLERKCKGWSSNNHLRNNNGGVVRQSLSSRPKWASILASNSVFQELFCWRKKKILNSSITALKQFFCHIKQKLILINIVYNFAYFQSSFYFLW